MENIEEFWKQFPVDDVLSVEFAVITAHVAAKEGHAQRNQAPVGTRQVLICRSAVLKVLNKREKQRRLRRIKLLLFREECQDPVLCQ